MIFRLKNICGLLCLILVMALSMPELSFSKSASVQIAGSTEKIDAFDRHDINYISFSELVDIFGGNLDWTIVGHTINYVMDTIRFEKNKSAM